MPELKWSKDGKVCFDGTHHTYMLGDKRLSGVTSFISKYIESFDTDRIATAYAAKHNLIKEEVIAGWKQENEKSTIQGSHVHKVLEDFCLTGVLDESNVQYKKQIHAVQFIKDYFLTGRLVPVETEFIVYNNEIASQIDLIAHNQAGQYFILDWKTNKKIVKESYRGKRMKHPFTKYMDCNFYHYSLQVAIYKKLCKEYNIQGEFIIHFGEENYEIIKPAPIIIPEWLIKT